MVALEQLFKAIKFVYLYGTNAKQLNILTIQNERKFLTTYSDPFFHVFPAKCKIREKRVSHLHFEFTNLILFTKELNIDYYFY